MTYFIQGIRKDFMALLKAIEFLRSIQQKTARHGTCPFLMLIAVN